MKATSGSQPGSVVHLASTSRMRFYTTLACSGRAVTGYYTVPDSNPVTCRSCKRALAEGRIIVADGVIV